MAHINSTVPGDLPSTRQLMRSTIIAALIACTLLVTVVLPAEHGIDPTGAGRVLGLTEMGEIKRALAEEARRAEQAPPPAAPTVTAAPASTPAPEPPQEAAPTSSEPVAPAAEPGVAAGNSHETTLTLAPGQGKEIKLVMREGARVSYSWSTDGGVVNYDTHGDSQNPRRDYHGYAKGTGVASDSGELVAAFEGSHGWFWRNRTRGDVTVTLRTEGDYSALKQLK